MIERSIEKKKDLRLPADEEREGLGTVGIQRGGS